MDPLNIAPGEPAPEADPTVAPVDKVDEATGTPADHLPAPGDDILGTQIADWFEEREKASKGPEADEAPAAPAPDKTPAPEDADPSAAGETPPVEGQEGVETAGGAGEGVEATDAPTGISIAGREYTEDEAAEMVALRDWATSLPPEATQAINMLLGGTHVLVPREDFDKLSKGEAASPGAAGVPVVDDDDLDPAVAARLKAYDAKIAALESERQAAAQADSQAKQARLLAAVNTASDTVAQELGLSPEEMQRLQTLTQSAQIAPAFAARYPNDPERAFKESFLSVYYADPAFRDREYQRRAAQDAEATRAIADKKRKASAVGGGSPAVARVAPNTAPATKEARFKAMSDELAAAMNGN